MKQLTKTDVINEVVEFYGKDPKNRRSIAIRENGSESCKYKGENNKCCAFARYVNDESKTLLVEGKNSGTMIDELGYDILKDNVKHIQDRDFWYDIQQLHDSKICWDFKNNGLSEDGNYQINKLLDKYNY